MMMKKSTMAGVAAGAVVISGLFAMNMQQRKGYTNLKVLPKDISRSELGNIMFEHVRDLGLPGSAGQACLYCHAGDPEAPINEWDFASDDNPMKEKARAMMVMVKAINEDHLSKLESRIDSSFKVTCASCHTGRADPRPLPIVLWDAFEEGGAEAASSKYRDLRAQHYGSNAYDFRMSALARTADRMAKDNKFDAAIAMVELNIEFYPEEVSLKRAVLSLKLERTITKHGVEQALAELVQLEQTPASEVIDPELLNALARRMLRSNRIDYGRALLEANYAKFPDEYVTNESMAIFSAQTGDVDKGVAILEKWLEKTPDHQQAKAMLSNLSRMRRD